MAWEYGIIGLVIGVFIGAIVMRLSNKKLREHHVQYELDKAKAELASYRNELIHQFARSAELLDNIAQDHRKLYQHLADRSNETISVTKEKPNSYIYQGSEVEADNDQPPIQIPRDYPGDASGLLRGMTAKNE